MNEIINTELQSLQNAIRSLNHSGTVVREYFYNDKRKTVKKYFISYRGETISPVLDYDKLNHFILGMIKMKKLI